MLGCSAELRLQVQELTQDRLVLEEKLKEQDAFIEGGKEFEEVMSRQ